MGTKAAASLFAILAVAFGLAMVFVTPPFQVPDEVGHYWHAWALATGAWAPNHSGRLEVPQGARDLVMVTWVGPGTHDNFAPRLRQAGALPHSSQRVAVRYFGQYSPLAYLPQTLACLIGEALRLRPLVTFYVGRIANLLSALAIIFVAIRLADELAWPIVAAGILPMSIFLFASYSADALTIALTCLTTVLARSGHKASVPVAFLTGLCKPPYLLVACLVLCSKKRSAMLAVVAALAGAAIALPFELGVPSVRGDVEPATQIERIIHEPLQVAAVVARDVAHQAPEYLDQFVGRFGWLEIPLPRPAYYVCLLMLIVIAVVAGVNARPVERIAAAAILVACIVLIELSELVTWTPPHAAGIEGVQGRYFLPLIPVAYMVVSRRARSVKWVPLVVATAAIIADSAAVVVVWQRYFGV